MINFNNSVLNKVLDTYYQNIVRGTLADTYDDENLMSLLRINANEEKLSKRFKNAFVQRLATNIADDKELIKSITEQLVAKNLSEEVGEKVKSEIVSRLVEKLNPQDE